jgi:nitrogen fixation protein
MLRAGLVATGALALVLGPQKFEATPILVVNVAGGDVGETNVWQLALSEKPNDAVSITARTVRTNNFSSFM